MIRLIMSSSLLFSDVPDFLFSDVPVFSVPVFSVPVFRCSCLQMFLFSSVPVFSVPAVRTLRPVGVGCVDWY